MSNIPRAWYPQVQIPSRWPGVNWFHPVVVNFGADMIIKKRSFFGINFGSKSSALPLITSVDLRTTPLDVLFFLTTQTLTIHSRDDGLPKIVIHCVPKSKALDRLYAILVQYTSKNILKLE